MIVEAIKKLIDQKNLTQKEAYTAMSEIMQGTATASQIAGFLVALRLKGETIDEIAGCALSMRDAARPLGIKAKLVLDTCGTGGDGRGSLNISTAAAFVVAGAGYTVAKHGNRAVSSHCGSADVLESLGVRLDSALALVEQCINDLGVGFMFAPVFHPAMKNAMPTRKELGVRTVFNILGPLTNPAKAQVQLIGVFKPELALTMAHVMKKMGHKAGLVVHSNGWDEITLEGKIKVVELLKGKIRSYTLTHKDFGLPKVASKHLMGASKEENAEFIMHVLRGSSHPAKNVVIANAAALIWIANRSLGKNNFSLKDAVTQAQHSIDSGKALSKSVELAQLSHSMD
jgi:anthranilate phosphoribosyltransferase